MVAQTKHQPDERQVLAKALVNAGKALGLSQGDLSEVVGRDRTSFSRGIDPHSKAGELALLFIRCYRSLYVLMGGEEANLRHWMHTGNQHIGGIPAERVKSIAGLIGVVEYLDAMRGKV